MQFFPPAPFIASLWPLPALFADHFFRSGPINRPACPRTVGCAPSLAWACPQLKHGEEGQGGSFRKGGLTATGACSLSTHDGGVVFRLRQTLGLGRGGTPADGAGCAARARRAHQIFAKSPPVGPSVRFQVHVCAAAGEGGWGGPRRRSAATLGGGARWHGGSASFAASCFVGATSRHADGPTNQSSPPTSLVVSPCSALPPCSTPWRAMPGWSWCRCHSARPSKPCASSAHSSIAAQTTLSKWTPPRASWCRARKAAPAARSTVRREEWRARGGACGSCEGCVELKHALPAPPSPRPVDDKRRVGKLSDKEIFAHLDAGMPLRVSCATVALHIVDGRPYKSPLACVHHES